MTSPTFTPGPWIKRGDKLTAMIDTKTGENLARVYSTSVLTGKRDIPSQANARLIAAAPELYEALERCMFALGRSGANVAGGPGRAEWEQARAALAKAVAP